MRAASDQAAYIRAPAVGIRERKIEVRGTAPGMLAAVV